MSPKSTSLLVLLLSYGYAIVRHNVMGDVPGEDIPLFVLNKALAYAGLLNLGIAGLQSNARQRHQLGMGAIWLLMLHVIISLVLFSPSYYPKFFHDSENSRLTFNTSLSLLAGAIAFVCLLHLLRTSITKHNGTETSLIRGLGRITILLAALHTTFMGYKNWFSTEQ